MRRVTHVNDAHYLHILVRKIRQKIEKDPTLPQILITELGVGYRPAQGPETEYGLTVREKG